MDLSSVSCISNERLNRDLVRLSWQHPTSWDLKDSIEIEGSVEAASRASVYSIAIGGNSGLCKAVTWDMVVAESSHDKAINLLLEKIRSGISNSSQDDWPLEIQSFYRLRKDLSEKDGVVMFKKRVVVPRKLQTDVLEILHAAHQGCSSMEARASQSVWWPGLKDCIAKKRAHCQGCNQVAPSQPALPPVLLPSPDYPMQQICSDIAHYAGHTYVVIVDRFSNWPSVYKSQGAEGLVKAL